MTLRLIPSAIFLTAVAGAFAQESATPQQLFDNGDFEEARAMIEQQLAASPKAKNAGELNQLLGLCCEQLGDDEEALEAFNKAAARGVADAWLNIGRLRFQDYDFDGANEAYAKYKSLKTKAKKPLSDDYERDEQRLNDAENFLERVEQIQIIDSIAVPTDELLKAYRLPPSAGSLRGPESLPQGLSDDEPASVFISESGDLMMWAEPDEETGRYGIVQATRLTDGSWHKEKEPFLELAENGDADYPFMMSDGTTLYFASDGDGSIGGYDIFVASSDPSTGEYMQPQNMGMPYNSPYDDYMLAIDELNGVGWWATDRNQLDGLTTIYVFATNDLRRNYDPDDEDIIGKARIDDFASTQTDDFTDLLAEIRAIDPNAKAKRVDFHWPMSGGRVYTNLNDFKTPAGRNAMKEYLKAQQQFDQSLATLAALREKYHDGNRGVAQQILSQEKKIDAERETLKKLKNAVYKAEK